jgi:hypothetical protein
MNFTVQFFFGTIKINNIRIYVCLSSEFSSVKLPFLNLLPKENLCISQIISLFFSVDYLFVVVLLDNCTTPSRFFFRTPLLKEEEILSLKI